MSNQPMLQLTDVTKRIGRKTIVDKLSLEVYPGEVFGFLGPNGAGKTTTIRMIVGLMALSGGEIRIRGKSIAAEYSAAIREVGAIVENPEMYKYLSGYRNLLHYARMVPGIPRQRIEEVIDLVGLKSRIKDKVRTYSLGMRQRLGVAQALLHKPSLLILDEPTNGLDPAGIRELRDYLRDLAVKDQVAVLVSSHLLSEMELMCDRVAVIQQGKLIDVKEIRSQEAVPELQLYSFETDDPEGASRTLAESGAAVELDGGHVRVRADREQIPGLVASLVGAGVAVYGVRAERKSLEDQFLELTGGRSID